MALAAVKRNALLEEVWALQEALDYVAIVELLREVPLEDHVREPELGVTLCYAWYQLGELNESLSLIEKLTPACERRGNTRLCRRRMNNEAIIRLARGETEAAEPLLQRVLLLAEAAVDHQYVAFAQNNLGLLHYMRGMWEFAISHFKRAIAASQRIGDISHLLACHVNIGGAYHKVGDLPMARAHFEEGWELTRIRGSESEIAHVELGLAFQYEAEGDLLLAKVFADRVHERFGRIGHSKGQGGAYQVHGRIHLREGRFEEAESCLLEALERASTASHKDSEGSIAEDLAQVFRARGDMGTSVRWLKNAIAVYTEIGNRSEVARLKGCLEDPA